MDASRKKKWTDRQVLEADPRTMDAGECSAMLLARGVDVPDGRVRRAQLVELVTELQDRIRATQGAAVTPSAESRKRSNSTRKKTATKTARSKAVAAAEEDADEAAETTPVRPKRKSGTVATKKAAESAAEGEGKKQRSSAKAGTKRQSSAASAKRTTKHEVKEEEAERSEEEESEKEEEEEAVAEPPKKTRQSAGARSKKHVAAAEKPHEESEKEEEEEEEAEESEHEKPPKKKAKRSSSVSSSKAKRAKKAVEEEEEAEKDAESEKEQEKEADETEFIRKRSPRKSLETSNRELARTATVLGVAAAAATDENKTHEEEEDTDKTVAAEPETERVRRPSFLQRLFGGKPSSPAPAPAPAPEKAPETAQETTEEASEKEEESAEEKEAEVEQQKPSEENEQVVEEHKDEPVVERAPRLSFFKKIFAAKPAADQTTEAAVEEQKAPETVANEVVPAPVVAPAVPVVAEQVESHEQPRGKRSLRLSFFQKFFVHKTPETATEPAETPAPAPVKEAQVTEPVIFKEVESGVAAESQSPRKSLRAQAAEREAAKRESIAAAQAAEQELQEEEAQDAKKEEEGVHKEGKSVAWKLCIVALSVAVALLAFAGARYAMVYGQEKPSGIACGDGMMWNGTACVYSPAFVAELKKVNQALVRYLSNMNALSKGIEGASWKERRDALLEKLFGGYLGGFDSEQCIETEDGRVSVSLENAAKALERVAPYTRNTILHGHTLREMLYIALDDVHRCPALHIDRDTASSLPMVSVDLHPADGLQGAWDALCVPLAVLAALAAVGGLVYAAWRHFPSRPATTALVDSARTILKDQAAAALAQATAVSDADISADHAAVMPAYLTVGELRNQLLETQPVDRRTSLVTKLQLWWAVRATRNNSAVRSESTDIQGVPQETLKWIGAINM